uniref:Uncharacterized protein n=1 Tax=Tanacetum cinerariifolium TaxID=118510 RepID=A0A699IFX4_TANCI|nr:hypothetical protein [Tanacetum cinerariifolium]
MSTQQDIYAAGSESRPPMLNKENYVPWSSRLLRHAKSRPNGKLTHNSILNCPYVRKLIPEQGDANRDITVTETFHLQTDDELSDKELKQIETKDLHTADYTQLYDFLKYNQKEVDELKAQRLAKTQDPLALMANSNNPYNGLIGVQGNGNHNQIGNGNLVAARAEGSTARQNGNQIRCYNCRGIDGSAEVHENCDDNEIFNMFTQKEQYTELLEPILESHQVSQTDNDVISKDTGVEQGGETVEQHHKMALGYQNPFYLKQAQKKQQSLYDGKVLHEKHDPPVVHDLEETPQLAQESHDKMKQMNKEIKQANYTKINHLSGVFVPQKALSREESYFSNNYKTANVSKSFLIPNEDLSDETTPSVARKFLNEEAAKFVRDFKSLANEADASLAKHKALELEIERLLKAVVSQDIMIIVQNN